MNQGSGTPALQPSKALARERMRRLQECDKLALLMGSGLAKYAIEIGSHGGELQAGINRGPLQVESFGQRSREPHFRRCQIEQSRQYRWRRDKRGLADHRRDDEYVRAVLA